MNNIKSFIQYKINENLSQSSKEDLKGLRDELVFINNYNVDIYSVIQILNELLTMNWTDILELREHINTNYSKDDKDELTLRIIDRYCSNIEDKE